MYLQNEKTAKLWIFVDFSNKRRLGQIYKKILCKMKLQDELQREVVRKCSVKKVFLKTSQNSQKNNFFGVSFLIKLHASCLNIFKKWDSNTGVFPWIWGHLLRTISLKKISGGCFFTKGLFLPLYCKEKSFKAFFNFN